MSSFILVAKNNSTARSVVVLATLLLGLGGTYFIMHSHATTPTVSLEPENSVLGGGAIKTTDASASNGQAVQFTLAAQTTHDYVQDFNTAVAAWPTNGNPPTGYGPSGVNTGGFCAYADGTSGKYYPSQVLSVHDGMLDYYNHNAMAAAVLPFCYNGFTYGTYTVRMRMSGTYSGYHNAFLLWPDSGIWPADGEFDYPENETSALKPYVAVVQPNASFLPPTTTYVPQSWTDGQFHDYTQQWGPGFLRTYQDGVLVATVTSNIPAKPMHPVMQNEFSNTLQDPAKPSTTITGHTYVDRVTYDRSYTLPPSAF